MSASVADRIHDATLEVLREQGLASLSVEGVAARSGVAKTTIYRRYRNSADLATAALAATAPRGAQRGPSQDTRAALVDFLVAFGSRFEQVGMDVLGSMLAERDAELLQLHRERMVHPRVQQAVALLREGQERGELRADPELDLELVMEMLVGSFFSRHIVGRELSVEEWAERAVATLWRGLEP